MAGIILTYDIAMAAARDAGNRSMRAGGRSAWDAADALAAANRMDALALAFYRGEHPDADDAPLDLARYELAQTRGISCISGVRRVRRV